MQRLRRLGRRTRMKAVRGGGRARRPVSTARLAAPMGPPTHRSGSAKRRPRRTHLTRLRTIGFGRMGLAPEKAAVHRRVGSRACRVAMLRTPRRRRRRGRSVRRGIKCSSSRRMRMRGSVRKHDGKRLRRRGRWRPRRRACMYTSSPPLLVVSGSIF